MAKASKRLDDEKKFLSKICDESSLKRILNESEIQYIGQHQFKLQSEFEAMIVNGQHEGNCLNHLPFNEAKHTAG
jgi:hypothetical protein